MRAVIVYESMFGNTRRVAEAIAAGVREIGEAAVVPVAEASHTALGRVDLIVVGGPTHMHGMSRVRSRQMAADMAKKPAANVSLEPGATGMGVREWFDRFGPMAGAAAAFDTKLPGMAAFTGRASKRISRLLQRHGARVIAVPQSFIVLKTSDLAPGELERATEWGRRLAGTVAAVPTPTSAP